MKNSQQFDLTDDTRLRNCIEYINNLPVKSGYVVTITKESRPRTTTQNAALHKYFELLADKLNDAGLYKLEVFEKMREGFELPWTKNSIKEDMWFHAMKSMTGKKSTTEMTTKEVDMIYKALDAWLGEKLGVHVEFPERDD